VRIEEAQAWCVALHKQQTTALSTVLNVNNTNILRQSIVVLSLVATTHPQP
jgi:hypothetical protein